MHNRIGQGIDIHQLEVGTPLIIGGVSIPYSKGSRGHSDGDVLYHAIVDAIFGALGLGDIGRHFPSDNERFKNADSGEFLEYAQNLMYEKGFSLINIDTTVIIQEPPLSTYIIEMRKNIANILSISIDRVSVKATTTDYMGFIGSKEGLSAIAVVLLSKTDDN